MNGEDSEPGYLPISPFVAPPADLQPALDTELHADVAIVGGGLTGLSTALALKRAGADPIVIEREFCGFGASGRNAGHLTPTIGKDMPTMLMLFGKKRTSALVRFAEHCVKDTERLITSLGIDCDYCSAGNILAVVHPAQEARLRKAVGLAQSVGTHVRFVEGDEMRERGLPPGFLCGALEGAGGTLNPGKLVLGLRRAALAAGVRIVEQTAVQRIRGGAKPEVHAANGRVSADRILVASNAYTREIGSPAGSKIFPFYVSLFETAPLSDEQLSAIGGWSGREGIYTAHESLESYRLTARRTIIGGAKGVRYVYGGKPSAGSGPQERTRAILTQAFRDRFPPLRDVPIQHFWGGWIAMTMHFLPAVGSRGDTIYHSIGYNGHGVAQACAMGDILADAMLGRSNPWLDTIARFVPSMPPEPLRWLVVRGLLGVVNAIDRRTDRQIREGLFR
jgi:glycine/D-amino acid oxidase-like deaminating enzyme